MGGKWGPLCDGREGHKVGRVQHVSYLAIAAAERRSGQAVGRDGGTPLSYGGCRATEKAGILLWIGYDWKSKDS